MALYHENSDGSKRTKCEPLNNNFSSSQIENLCLCPVCYMNFNEDSKLARILHCGHTFCTECILNVQKYGNSAHIECPTCRSETKSPLTQITPNYMVMELIRKFELLGPSAPSSELSLRTETNLQNVESQTIAELVDTSYRQMITNIKSDLLGKFEEMKEDLSEMSFESAKRELADLCDSIECAVREAYADSGSEDDNDDGDTSFSTVSTIGPSRSNPENVSAAGRCSTVTRGLRAIFVPLCALFRKMFKNRQFVENPLNISSGSDISFETTDESNETNVTSVSSWDESDGY